MSSGGILISGIIDLHFWKKLVARIEIIPGTESTQRLLAEGAWRHSIDLLNKRLK
jgi:hypothetical protein